MGYLYRRIGIIILSAGCLLAAFLPWIFPDSGFSMGIIYFAYFAFLFSSLLGYFINYRQNLLGADQRNYVVTAYYQSANILKMIIQMASAYYTGSYYLWVAIELVFGVIYSFILNWKINKTYPWLRAEVRLGKQVFKKYPEVMIKTRQLFVHKIGGFAQFQLAPVLVYAYASLDTVAKYGNYTLVFNRGVDALLSNLFGSMGASVGNLIAEGDRKNIVNTFWQLVSFRFFTCGIFIFGLLCFTNPFITLWVGEEYVLPDIVLYLLLANFFLNMQRTPDAFLNGYGMFYDVWSPLTETTIYVIVAIAGGHLWGLPGVIFGNTVSLLLLIGIWKPFFLFSKGFKMPVRIYWYGWTKMLLVMLLSIFVVKWVMDSLAGGNITSWWGWVSKAAIYTALFTIVYAAALLATAPPFRRFVMRFIKR